MRSLQKEKVAQVPCCRRTLLHRWADAEGIHPESRRPVRTRGGASPFSLYSFYVPKFRLGTFLSPRSIAPGRRARHPTGIEPNVVLAGFPPSAIANLHAGSGPETYEVFV